MQTISIWCISLVSVVTADPGLPLIADLPISSLSCSGTYNNWGLSTWDPRFGKGRNGAWSAESKSDPTSYLQVDLGSLFTISSVATAGREQCCDQWTTNYDLFYSADDSDPEFTYYGNFAGNEEPLEIVTHTLSPSITARHLRFVPVTFNKEKALRIEAYGVAITSLEDHGNPEAHCGCLEECWGDCDYDDDCVGDLKCWHRSEGEGIPPGCSGEVHEPSHDYCYDPGFTESPSADPTKEPTSVPTADPTVSPSADPTSFVFLRCSFL